MSLFGSTASSGFSFGGAAKTTTTTTEQTPIEIPSAPTDTVSSLRFSPKAPDFLVSTSWDNLVRCWEVQANGQAVPKAEQKFDKPVLSSCWHADGTKVFLAGADNQGKVWDLGSNTVTQVAVHDAPIKTVHWIQAPGYQCLMTGSWDKTLKFWDTRQPTPIKTFQTGQPVYCADVIYPMAIVSTAQQGILVYQLTNEPQEFKKIDSPLKYQHRCVAICKDKQTNTEPVGFALGSVEGRVAIQYIQPKDPKDNYTFKCHRSDIQTGNNQDIYAVNDIAFHPGYGTLATAGSDGKFSFWDKDARTKLKTSTQLPQSITACTFNSTGNIFAYALGYDWTKGHESNNPNNKPSILLRDSSEELKPRSKNNK